MKKDKRITQENLAITISMVGELIERKDREKSWLKQKDQDRQNIKNGVMTRRTAVSTYTQLRKEY